MKNVFLIFCLVGLLTACGTTVPLGDVPVTDATPRDVAGMSAGASANGAGVKGNGVAPVELGAAGSQSAVAPSVPRVVYFDYDSYVIKPDFQSLIAAHARFVKAQPDRKVAIEGHTDETGGREYNLALGQRRADAVRNAFKLRKQGGLIKNSRAVFAQFVISLFGFMDNIGQMQQAVGPGIALDRVHIAEKLGNQFGTLVAGNLE